MRIGPSRFLGSTSQSRRLCLLGQLFFFSNAIKEALNIYFNRQQLTLRKTKPPPLPRLPHLTMMPLYRVGPSPKVGGQPSHRPLLNPSEFCQFPQIQIRPSPSYRVRPQNSLGVPHKPLGVFDYHRTACTTTSCTGEKLQYVDLTKCFSIIKND